uniref:Uncharacterized protein n=1 Tax=Anguilla anguilla TaxID=7936 RepID=A0A0E9WEC8_ANGAN
MQFTQFKYLNCVSTLFCPVLVIFFRADKIEQHITITLM